jgi:hypothetical protein
MKKILEHDSLLNFVSINRLTRYLEISDSNTDLVVYYYLQNLAASQQLYGLIHWAEVGLRNAINGVLIKRYGEDWLNKPKQCGLSALAIQKIIAVKEQLTLSHKPTLNGDIIAAMNFSFWVVLLDRDHEQLWRYCLSKAFKHKPTQIDRKMAHKMTNKIRQLRNRIAHYEPIIHLKPANQMKDILQIIRWIDQDVYTFLL